jgi:hypothetical protein
MLLDSRLVKKWGSFQTGFGPLSGIAEFTAK